MSNSNTPFQLIGVNVTQKIANCLEGDDLKNFKLSCKMLNDITKGWSCAIQITIDNFKRTCDIPGYHIIRMTGPELEFNDYLNFSRVRLYPNIKHLIIDHQGVDVDDFDYQIILIHFDNLQSLRIIRCKHSVNLEVDKDDITLSFLEVYTSGFIKLKLKKEIKKALLCSTQQKEMENYSNIIIELPRGSHINQASGTRCYAKKSTILHGSDALTPTPHPFGTFVPKPKYLA